MSQSKNILAAVGLLVTAISSAFAGKKASDHREKRRKKSLEKEEGGIDKKLKEDGK
ncbi:hypothetical protein [Citrobacter portucalensis]|uniref:hypothetical protein n=1 Tax=Citrobacter portucalensis TaxID=1639133 RepID=UPI002B237EB6|nr:hypothetical protein [Citrobacter portucalensis]MEB0898286.1 hypothetical protein [Citrobacter portucalensis]